MRLMNISTVDWPIACPISGIAPGGVRRIEFCIEAALWNRPAMLKSQPMTGPKIVSAIPMINFLRVFWFMRCLARWRTASNRQKQIAITPTLWLKQSALMLMR